MEKYQQELNFLHRLQNRIKDDSVARAALKRSLGSSSPQHRFDRFSVCSYFLKGVPKFNWDKYFLVAALFAHYPQETLWHEGRSFAWTCRHLEATTTTQGVDRRLRQLLACPQSDIERPLCDLFEWARQRRIQVDYPVLLHDLCWWSHPDEFVQHRWATDFWRIGE